MSKRRKHDQPRDSFVVHSLAMRQSPAWKALPNHARRVLDRLEVEHMQHAGAENGALVCTYSDFEAAQIPYKAIAPAIRQCVALGFVEITHQGTPSVSEFRNPSKYRLTYVYGRQRKLADGTLTPQRTDEWRKIESDAQAISALESVAGVKSAQHVRRAKSGGIQRAA